MHPMVMREVAKIRVAERRAEARDGRRPRIEARFRSALGRMLVGVGMRFAGPRAVVGRIEGDA